MNPAPALSLPTLSSHGAEIPLAGFGTSPLTGDVTPDNIVAALHAGYRHLDTGRKYGTERATGEGMRASGIPRKDIFLTTKVSHENLRETDFARSVDESLKALKVDYFDLLMIHWPNLEIPVPEAVKGLAKAKRQGVTRHIGIANFNTTLIEQALKSCPEPIAALQAEYHPYLDQTKVLAACNKHGLAFVAYCPLGRGRLFDDPVLGEIARNRGRTVAQIALRWLIQQNVAAIPRSSNAGRIAANLNVFDFTLGDDEMKRIAALKRPDGRIANPVERVPPWD
jgi:diketogulonate reductase-like aldo/keto reductase